MSKPFAEEESQEGKSLFVRIQGTSLVLFYFFKRKNRSLTRTYNEDKIHFKIHVLLEQLSVQEIPS